MCSISKTPFFCKQKISAHEGTEKSSHLILFTRKIFWIRIIYRVDKFPRIGSTRRIDNGEEKFNARLGGTNY